MKCFKKLLSLALLLLMHIAVMGQGQYLQIISPKDQKQLFIKEGKRIRILTNMGQRIAGRYSIKDPQTIIIKGQEFPLTALVKIKRDPLLYHVIMGSALFLATAVASVVIYYSYSTDLSVVTLFAGAYGLLKTPNILKGFKKGAGAQFRIINANYKPGKEDRHERKIR